MLHLFKEIYADYDTNVNVKYYRVVISDANGYPVDSSLNPAILLHHARSFDDLIGDGKQFSTFSDFITFLSNKHDELGYVIQIYLDKPAFAKFTANWYKLLFVNCTAESAFNIVKSYQTKAFNATRTRNNSNNPHLLTLSEFTSVFNLVTEDFSQMARFVVANTDKLSTELIVPAYYNNGSLGNILAERLRVSITNDLAAFFKEVRSDILNSALNPAFRQAIGSNLYTINNVEEMINDPALDIFFKIHDVVQTNAISPNPDWSSISINEIDAVIALLDHLTREIYRTDRVPFLHVVYLLKHLSLSDGDWLDIILAHELALPSSFSTPTNILFNSLFVENILSPVKVALAANTEPNTSYLSPYALRGTV